MKIQFTILFIFFFTLIDINGIVIPASTSSSSQAPVYSSNHEKESTHILQAEPNEILVRKGELLACGKFHCQIVKEFTFQEKHGFKCLEETLMIKFFSISNGTKTDIQAYLNRIKTDNILEDEQSMIPINLIINAEKKHKTC